jgi:hypothetical protein
MNSFKGFAVVGSLLSLLCLNAQALPLSFNVSADSNPAGVFSFLSQPAWSSGDIALPNGTIIGSTPLEIDLTLSHNLTLDNAPGGTENFGWGLFFSSPIPNGADYGTVMMELLENGVVITPQFGFDLVNNTGFDEIGVGTGTGTTLPVNLVFNGVNVFVSNSNPNGAGVSDVEVGLPVVQGVPDTSNTLPLLSLGLVAMFGFGYRKVNAVRSQV